MLTREDFYKTVNTKYPDSVDTIEGILQYDKYLTYLVKENTYNIKNTQLQNYLLCMDYCLEKYKTIIPLEKLEQCKVINKSNKKETISIKNKKSKNASLIQLLSLVKLIPHLEDLDLSRRVELLNKNCNVYRPHLWILLEQSLD